MAEKDKCVLVHDEKSLKEILTTRDRVIALFYASWCPYCVTFLPTFQKAAEEEGRHFVMVRDDDETMADQYAVTVYPTVLFFENGIVLKRLDGVLGVGLDEKQLKKFVQSYR